MYDVTEHGGSASETTQSSDGDSRWTVRQMGLSDKPVSDKSGVTVQAVMYLQLITVTVMLN